jgi:ketosteroid isomerase-like protein
VSEGAEAAAAALVAAFAEGRVEDYFACFASDATFVFHTTPERLDSRDAYRELWRRWEVDDGFGVLACTSSNQRVQMIGERAAVYVHDVVTRVTTRSGEEELRERETIVFERRGDRWLAMHEHLSPMP